MLKRNFHHFKIFIYIITINFYPYEFLNINIFINTEAHFIINILLNYIFIRYLDQNQIPEIITQLTTMLFYTQPSISFNF